MLFGDSDMTANFFFLVLLGIFIAWGLFLHGGHTLPKALRDAVIWGLIFVMMITAYGFKDTFLAQLNPSEPQSIGEGSVVLTRALDGAFYANLVINGKQVETLVDTGASDLVLTRADAERVGVDMANLSFIGQASTANGVVSTAGTLLDSVQLGEIVDFDVRARVNGGELNQTLLGMTYLNRFRSWQVEGDRMILRR